MERTQPIARLVYPTPLQVGMFLFAITTALVIAIFLLAGANEYDFALLSFFVSEPLAALVGGLIIARQPRNLVGWFIVGHAFCWTFAEFARQYALYGMVTQPGSLPFAHALTWFTYWLWGPGILLGFILLPLYFPNGKPVSRPWRFVTWYAVIVSTFVTFSMAFSPGDHETPGIPNPLGFLPASYIDSWVNNFAQASWMIGVFLAAASVLVRFHQANVQEKQQIKWLFYAMIFLLVGLFLPAPPLIEEIIGSISIAGLWVAIGIAVLRYGLYNIDIIISRTLVYIALTAVIVTAYLLTAGVLGALIPSSGNLVNALIAASLVAVIFQPLRERLQRSVNRLLYGERDEPYALLTRLGRRLEETLAPDQALPTIVETVATALKLPYAAIVLGEGAAYTLAAEYIRPARIEGTAAQVEPVLVASAPVPANLVRLPLVHQRQHLGELHLGLRPGEQAFGPADWRLLTELARQIGVAVASAQLTLALQHAREQLVAAREEERRRLRRDLHDGLGPLLAAQRLKLGTARYFLHKDPAVADRLLTEQEGEIDAALQEVRRLIDNLRPPVLDDLGLAVAIQRIATNYGVTVGETSVEGTAGVQQAILDGDGTSLQIKVDVPHALPPLPAAVEVACYRIVQEALTNVARHAHARHCRVALEVGDRMLLLTVCDDGRGVGEPGSNGLGLHSMRARAEELGGTIMIEPNRPTGTVVRVQLPIATVAERAQ